ncbi:MAG: carboxypeptidase regulatory-like domain-containing protein [Saprospiraceae bacterium]
MKNFYVIPWVICFLLFQNITIHSQTSITGKITDIDTGEEMIAANIIVSNAGVFVAGETTDIDGNYSIRIDPGTYDVRVSYTGYVDHLVRSVIANAGQATKVDVQLGASEAVLEEVVVKAYKVPLIKMDATSTGSTVTAEHIRNLPTRNINSVAAATVRCFPGDKDGGVSVKGSRSSATDYYVDGKRVKGKEMLKDSKVKLIKTETAIEDEYLIGDARILISNNKFFESTDYILRDKIDLKNNFPMVELDPTKIIVLKKNIITPPKAGQLTAAEWRDADHWKVWKTQQKDKDYKQAKSDWKFYLTNRYAVLVENKQGQPLVDVEVELVNAKRNVLWKTRTDNEGKADLWAGIFDRREDARNLKIIATYNGKKHTIRKAKSFKKVNKIKIKTDCNLSNRVDIMFAVDATGSMGDEINYLKSELQNVIERVQQSDDDLDIRLGSVFYRDVRDAYLTQSTPLDPDISKTVSFIKKQSAGGGGDFPEAVDVALEETIQKQNWSKDAVARIVFLVLDAPPHMQQENINSLQKSIRIAAEKGIKIIPVTASGINRSTEYLMKTMALATTGTYVFITDDSGIGNSHLKPKTKDYEVEKLNDLLVRLIGKYTDRTSCEEVEKEEEEQNNEVLFANNNQNTNFTTTVIKEDKSILNKVKYFPNPATTSVTLQLQEAISEILIIQADGKVVRRFENVAVGEMQIDLSGFSEGFYLIRFRKENDVANGKLIVIKS